MKLFAGVLFLFRPGLALDLGASSRFLRCGQGLAQLARSCAHFGPEEALWARGRGVWLVLQFAEMAMGQKPVPPVNIPIPTKIE